MSSSMAAASISLSTRILTNASNSKVISKSNFFNTPLHFLKPLILSSPCSLTSSRSISFQKLPTKFQTSSSSSSNQSVEELPPKLQEIIKLFQSVDNPRAKYQQLLFYANKLPPLDDKYKIKENKVEGCVSQVWVRAFLGEDSKDVVYYEIDSDSVMTKGLAALLVLGLSGQPIAEIVRVTPDFVTLLGLQQNLTPSRNNGFVNMLRLMQRKALVLGMEAEKSGSGNSRPKGGNGGGNGLVGEESLSLGDGRSEGGAIALSSRMGVDDSRPKGGNDSVNGLSVEESLSVGEDGSDVDGVNGEESSISDVGRGENGGRGERMREVLERELKPVELVIEDVSYQHAGHAGVRETDGETHFNLKIVSNEFQGKSLVKRHRMIYGLLQDELQGGLHALSIDAKTPVEVEER